MVTELDSRRETSSTLSTIRELRLLHGPRSSVKDPSQVAIFLNLIWRGFPGRRHLHDVQDAAPNRDVNSRSAISHLKLREHILQMRFDRIFTNHE